jgi:hypothetical protein
LDAILILYEGYQTAFIKIDDIVQRIDLHFLPIAHASIDHIQRSFQVVTLYVLADRISQVSAYEVFIKVKIRGDVGKDRRSKASIIPIQLKEYSDPRRDELLDL